MDGWHLVYTNWGDGEPSDPDATGGCVSMHADGRWYDDPCDSMYAVPCKTTDGKRLLSTWWFVAQKSESFCPTSLSFLADAE